MLACFCASGTEPEKRHPGLQPHIAAQHHAWHHYESTLSTPTPIPLEADSEHIELYVSAPGLIGTSQANMRRPEEPHSHA